MTPPASTAGVEVTQAPYLSGRFDWAAPGDQQEDAWLVRFCDKDCGEAVLTGPDAERDAWEYWNRYAPGFNLYVFRLARLAQSAPAPAVPGEVERLREALTSAIEVLKAIRRGLSGQAYDLTGCIERARAALATPPATTDADAARDKAAGGVPAGIVHAENEQLELLRRREVQAIGAAISTRNWHDLETAYNAGRDRLDRILIARRRKVQA